MKNTLFIFFVSLIILSVGCSVDDYQDANPTRLLNSPAVDSVWLSDDNLIDGETTTDISLRVVDAPAGIASAVVVDTDDLGVAITGSSFTITEGVGTNRGVVVVQYTVPEGYVGAINLAVSVADGQLDDDGEDASKTSVARNMVIDVNCGDLTGTYAVTGTILVDDFNSGPYNSTEDIVGDGCNAYAISDISGGLYAGSYADSYETDPAEATVSVDAFSNVVTWTGVSDQFGGEIIEDPDGDGSNFNPGTGTFTIYWTATTYGERGVTVLTLQ